MHERENTVEEAGAKDPLIRRAFGKSHALKGLALDTAMHNSGVIGIHPTEFHRLESALELTDELCRHGLCHIWEQIAVSLCLATDGSIVPATAGVLHYWGQQAEYQRAIGPVVAAIRKANMGLEDAVAYFRSHPISVPLPRPPRLLRRAWRFATGGRWRPACWRPGYRALYDTWHSNGKSIND